MGQVTHYDDTAKINAAYLYAAFGNYSKVSRDTNISRPTLMGWAKDNQLWVESVAKARHEISDELLAQNLAIATTANGVVLDRLVNGDHKLVQSKDADGKYHRITRVPMQGRDAAVVGGIMQDKARVQMGLATSITATQDNRELADVCKELSRTMRDHGVVSTQQQVNKPDE